jgi:hypothetical protein
MKIERFAGHNEAREALVLSVASVTADYTDRVFAFADLVLIAWLFANHARQKEAREWSREPSNAERRLDGRLRPHTATLSEVRIPFLARRHDLRIDLRQGGGPLLCCP